MYRNLHSGELVPESETDLGKMALSGEKVILECVNCHNPFNFLNVFTYDGWAETQISGFCEVCFDGIANSWDEDEDEDESKES